MNQCYPVVVRANVSGNDDTSDLRNAIFVLAHRESEFSISRTHKEKRCRGHETGDADCG
jgi:hypothetical protein